MTRFRRGTTFLNRYVLLGPIGRGSVSVVYEAEDTLNSRRVAIKLLEPSLAADPRARDRVRHPAMIMTMLREAGVPRVYEFGDAPFGDGATIAYSVLEYLTGESLDSRLAHGPLPWPDAVGVAATVADVLTVAHAQGIALGQLGPASILLCADGPRVVDVDAAGGMPRSAEPSADARPVDGGARTANPRATGAGARRTRHRDRTPEQPAAEKIGPSTGDDIRALGALLREMVAGSELAEVPAALPMLWQSCLEGPGEQPDAATMSLELWGLLAGPIAAGPRRAYQPPLAYDASSGYDDGYPEPYDGPEYDAPAYNAPAYDGSAYDTPAYDGSAFFGSVPAEPPPYDGPLAYERWHPVLVELETAATARSRAEAEREARESAARARGAMARATLDRKPRSPSVPAQYPPARHQPAPHQSTSPAPAPAGETPQTIPVGYSGQGGRHRRRRALTGPSDASTGRA